MATTKRTMVMSVFADNAQAQQAMDDLQRVGFSPYSVRKSGTGIADSLENLGLPEQEADFYNREFEAGRTVVMVKTDDRQQEANDILSRYSGYDYSTRSGQIGGYASTTSTDRQQNSTEDEQRLKLREEQLQVQKQQVETGEVRLRKDVVSEQQSMDVPVMHEEVYIERRPGSGQPSDQEIGEGETYRVPVQEEQVTVEKQAVVREEVAIGKQSVQETQRVTDSVRREEAHIERDGDIALHGSDGDEVSS